jgi:hypothetical protein
MIIFAIVLAILLVASNAMWLYFFRDITRDAARERWSLHERIRDPKSAMPNPEPKPMTKEDQAVLDDWVRSTEVQDEFDAVGRIDPTLPLRNDEK